MSSEKYPSEAAERFQVRLPDGLRDQIKESASTNGRSMNAEVVARLSGNNLSLRDLFAGQAPTAPDWFEGPYHPDTSEFIDTHDGWGPEPKDKAARDKYDQDVIACKLKREATWRYLFADAMLAEREKGGAS